MTAVGHAYAGLQYTVERTDDGKAYLLVQGDFSFNEDYSGLRSLIQSNHPIAVVFNSPGGNPSKAMELGRLIRAMNLATIQPRAYECASACALAFLGGVWRYADPGAIGVHQSSFVPGTSISSDAAVSSIQQLTADIVTYMVQMGVDPSLLQVALSYNSDDIRYLSKSEMERYRVTTMGTTGFASVSPSQVPQVPPVTATPPPPPQAEPQVAAAPYNPPDLAIPEAKTGRVRHPKGTVPLKSGPEGKSATVANLKNGNSVQILGRSGRWYRVRRGQQTGYLHDTWVYVDQYESGPFEERHIQVKSFENFADAEAYVRSSRIPVTAYMATNGWFAVTLSQTYSQQMASNLVRIMKANGSIPDDAYMTYGNTYVRKVCCR
jgi:hypothetical protein